MGAGTIADASPLIALQQIDRLALLERLYERIDVPPAVAREVTPTLPRLPPWITVRTLAQPMSALVLEATLAPGESEAISLARETGARLLILDDLAARRLAFALGFGVIGTAGVVVRAKIEGLIPAARPSSTSCSAWGSTSAPR